MISKKQGVISSPNKQKNEKEYRLLVKVLKGTNVPTKDTFRLCMKPLQASVTALALETTHKHSSPNTVRFKL